MKGFSQHQGISPMKATEKSTNPKIDEEGNIIEHKDKGLSTKAKKFKTLTTKISKAQKRSKLRKAGVKVEDPGGPILP